MHMKNSLSLPQLLNPNLNTSLQNYPRPMVVKTKEFKRKKLKVDVRIRFKDAKMLTLKEFKIDSSQVFPPKDKEEVQTQQQKEVWGTRNLDVDNFKVFLTENMGPNEFGKVFTFNFKHRFWKPQ